MLQLPTRSQSPRPCAGTKDCKDSGTASEETATTATAHHEKPPLLLPDLPDLALLRVLSYVRPEGLFAVGRTCRRLGELTRSAQPWHGKPELELKSCDQVRDLLRVAPPVEEWNVCRASAETWMGRAAVFLYQHVAIRDPDATRPTGVLRVVVRGPGLPKEVASLLRDVAPTVRRLRLAFSRKLDDTFGTLKDAKWSSLEHLDVTANHVVKGTMWPQDMVLPMLHTVSLDPCRGKPKAGGGRQVFSPAYLEALRSLLRAHSGQLRCVNVREEALLPLVDACPSDLHRLRVDLYGGRGQAEVAVLRRLCGLKELRIALGKQGIIILGAGFQDKDDVKVHTLLTSWTGALERLELHWVNPLTIRALGESVIGSSLRCLVLGQPSYDRKFVTQLPAALAALPRLLAFVLLLCPSYQMSDGESQEARLSMERLLRGLVRRAAQALHVVYMYDKREGFTLYFGHSEAESVGCQQCAEAAAAARHGLLQYVRRVNWPVIRTPEEQPNWGLKRVQVQP
ncbi:uncharacterized protein LOC113213721 [Frankliniella occidentalis]|uniref:Uncharacterized protein LOC113213721 n=1 Tax=Frankliniella occidentalis TaxID=133901 RepID=A0A6J1T4Y1_FRAOC|nr:uncharacterized protein LOC113213721 [Frankliniella occidentalis]XP_026288645.1 uncharacterized protein LOC113213721 [Frankliniella occidentalis]XP_052121174.1 uncharacterized protein LOC113213721 [Frankliniella occidentalis]